MNDRPFRAKERRIERLCIGKIERDEVGSSSLKVEAKLGDHKGAWC